MNREQKKKLKEAYSMLQDAEEIIRKLSSDIRQELIDSLVVGSLEQLSTEIGKIASNLSTRYNLH